MISSANPRVYKPFTYMPTGRLRKRQDTCQLLGVGLYLPGCRQLFRVTCLTFLRITVTVSGCKRSSVGPIPRLSLPRLRIMIPDSVSLVCRIQSQIPTSHLSLLPHVHWHGVAECCMHEGSNVAPWNIVIGRKPNVAD